MADPKLVSYGYLCLTCFAISAASKQPDFCVGWLFIGVHLWRIIQTVESCAHKSLLIHPPKRTVTIMTDTLLCCWEIYHSPVLLWQKMQQSQ